MLAVGREDTLYGGFTKPNSEDKNAFQKGANSIAWVMIRFMAVLVPIVFLILGITGGKWLESLCIRTVCSGRADAGNAPHGHHRLPCKRKPCYG